MKYRLPGLLVFLFLLGFSSITHAAEMVLARVGERQVTAADIKPYLDSMDSRERAALAADPAAANQFIRSMVLQQLLFQKAISEGYDKRPSVQDELELARQSAIANGFLQTSARVGENFPAEADMLRLYEENKASFLLPRQFRLSQIFIAAVEGAGELDLIQAQRKARQLHEQLTQKKADFATLAREESQEPSSASRGGDIGLIAENLLQPAIREKVAAMKVGEISEPLQLPGGWHIIQLQAVEESRQATFEETKPIILSRLRSQQEALNREAFLNALLQENPVVINELAFSDLINSAK
jgi:parvulin-like peptidyl-prolyl isomerase